MSKALLEKIDTNNIPQHVAVIMDGNGRWAKERGKLRIFGHTNAVSAVRETIETAAEIGVKYLTLYAFSTENWSRPQDEVDGLMSLLVGTIGKELKRMCENGIRLTTIGDFKSLPAKVQKELNSAIEKTKDNKRMTLVLALSYSSRWEITNAVKAIALDVKSGKINSDMVNDSLISSYLSTAAMPDPELMIRTSGEMRISNYLLWQLAYAELYFTKTLWPDFRRSDFLEAILDYQSREQRFGKTGDQIKKEGKKK